MRVFTVLHPTTFCNLACRYCWAPQRDNRARMPLEVVERALSQLLANPAIKKHDLMWLTGEPLVVGRDHFERVVDICRRLTPPHVARPEFVVQSNGTLIDRQWAAFFAANDFIVGVTIDGPRDLHDSQRARRSGRGSFDDAMRGIDLLIEHGVRGGAICVITRRTLERPADELFHFFHDRRIAWSYLIEARIGENSGSPDALSLEDSPRLSSFLDRLIELWGSHPGSYIRDFDQITRRLLGGKVPSFDPNNLGCLDIINVLPQGDFFWGNPELMSATTGPLASIRFNVTHDDVWAARASRSYLEIESAIHSGIDLCRGTCPHFVSCQGGNPAHKFYEHGRFDVSEHVTCQLNDQQVSNLLLARVEAELSMRDAVADV